MGILYFNEMYGSHFGIYTGKNSPIKSSSIFIVVYQDGFNPGRVQFFSTLFNNLELLRDYSQETV